MVKPQGNLLCVSGSVRVPSYCLATCRGIKDIAEAANFGFDILDPRELDLPIYNPDLKVEHYERTHAGVQRLIDAYQRADALIWVSPTYHGTISGVFKYILDFAEFLSSDKRPYFTGRAVGLIAINASTPFAAMRDCARELRGWLAPTQIELSGSDFDSEPSLSSDHSRRRITRLV